MRNTILRKLSAFLCVAVLSGCGGGGGDDVVIEPEPVRPNPGSVGDGSLDALLDWTRQTYRVPAVATVVVLNGATSETGAVGLRSITGNAAVTINDSWHIGSLTKGMTATLVGALVDQSIVSWDTRPVDVWPGLASQIRPEYASTTIRQFLAHTSGMGPVNTVASRYADSAQGTIVQKRRDLSLELLAEPLTYPPGDFNYTNGGYIVVAAMLEEVLSVPWETLMSDYVLSPLNMSDTSFGAPGVAGQLDQPLGHWSQGGQFVPVEPGSDADNPQVMGPAGTVNTTLDDYAKYMIAHLNGARGIDQFILSSTFDVIHTPLADGSAPGWGVSTDGLISGKLQIGHAGSNQRWYAIVRLFPELDAGILTVVNAGGSTAQDAIMEFEEMIVDRYEGVF